MTWKESPTLEIYGMCAHGIALETNLQVWATTAYHMESGSGISTSSLSQLWVAPSSTLPALLRSGGPALGELRGGALQSVPRQATIH